MCYREFDELPPEERNAYSAALGRLICQGSLTRVSSDDRAAYDMVLAHQAEIEEYLQHAHLTLVEDPEHQVFAIMPLNSEMLPNKYNRISELGVMFVLRKHFDRVPLEGANMLVSELVEQYGAETDRQLTLRDVGEVLRKFQADKIVRLRGPADDPLSVIEILPQIAVSAPAGPARLAEVVQSRAAQVAKQQRGPRARRGRQG